MLNSIFFVVEMFKISKKKINFAPDHVFHSHAAVSI